MFFKLMVHQVSWHLLHADTTKYVVVIATAKTSYKKGNFFFSSIESIVVP